MSMLTRVLGSGGAVWFYKAETGARSEWCALRVAENEVDLIGVRPLAWSELL